MKEDTGGADDTKMEKPTVDEATSTLIMEAIMKVDIAKIYNPPRNTKMAEKMGLQTGEAMDLTTRWDLKKEEHRKRAKSYVAGRKPCAPCSPRSKR